MHLNLDRVLAATMAFDTVQQHCSDAFDSKRLNTARRWARRWSGRQGPFQRAPSHRISPYPTRRQVQPCQAFEAGRTYRSQCTERGPRRVCQSLGTSRFERPFESRL